MKRPNYIDESVFCFFSESNYEYLKNEIRDKDIFIEDVFHDSFLSVRIEIINNGLTGIECIKQLFKEHYKENFKRYNSDKKQYVLFSNTILELLNIKINYGTNNLQPQ